MSQETDRFYFKNRARQIKQPQKKYIPEYERLNMEPKIENYDRSQIRRRPDVPGIAAPYAAAVGQKRLVPRQMRVSSGANKEHTWTESFDVPTGDAQPATHAYIDKDGSAHQFVEDREYKAGVSVQGGNARVAGGTSTESSKSDVAPGDFVVMHTGKILFIGNKEEAEELVWDMVSGSSGFKPTDPEEIMVLERLQIKVGASFVK